MAKLEISLFPKSWGELAEIAILMMVIAAVAAGVALGSAARTHVHLFWWFWWGLVGLMVVHLLRRAGCLLRRCSEVSRFDAVLVVVMNLVGFLSALSLFFRL